MVERNKSTNQTFKQKEPERSESPAGDGGFHQSSFVILVRSRMKRPSLYF